MWVAGVKLSGSRSQHVFDSVNPRMSISLSMTVCWSISILTAISLSWRKPLTFLYASLSVMHCFSHSISPLIQAPVVHCPFFQRWEGSSDGWFCLHSTMPVKVGLTFFPAACCHHVAWPDWPLWAPAGLWVLDGVWNESRAAICSISVSKNETLLFCCLVAPWIPFLWVAKLWWLARSLFVNHCWSKSEVFA